MPRLQQVSRIDARRFRTGRMCLDFAHTGGDGPHAVWELLHTPADLARWLVVVTDPIGVDVVGATDEDLARARRLRSAIWNTAQRAIGGRPPTAADRATINEVAAGREPVPELTATGISIRQPVDAANLLVVLARDAIDLFGGPEAERVRECASETCQLLFVDRSRPGARRWCSMQRCGNIAKVRAHRAKDPKPDR
jgi:predicted RNA-binding Zn ribbon-like protein